MTYIFFAVEPTPVPGMNFTGRAGDIDRPDISRLGVFIHCKDGFSGMAGEEKI